MTRPLFLYGTLRHLPLLQTLIGGPADVRPAILPEHRVVRWPEAENPYLEAHAGSFAEGLLLRGLTEDQRHRLDMYEVPFGYLAETRSVMCGDADLPADVYFPDATVPRSDRLWSLAAWEAEHAAVAVQVAEELAAYDPALQADEMRRHWGMIQARAQSRVRAASAGARAELRHSAGSDDHSWHRIGPPLGEFFRLGRMALRHRRFDGTSSEEIIREVLVGVDAALVLPYDARRDRVMLIEQFRPGPAWRHDPNPWALEPVAGIVDGGETPEDAARREGREEAGVEMDRLERMFSMYPSPGSSTDHFHCYLGHADLSDLSIGYGGLADENEDLRLHVLPLDEAIALTETGEAQTGPLIAMLLWTARHRARLAAET